MNKVLLFVFLTSLILISFVSATDVAYIVRNSNCIDNAVTSNCIDNAVTDVTDALDELGLTYDIITDNEIIDIYSTTNFNNYDMLIVGEGYFTNYYLIPVLQKKSFVMNTKYLSQWKLGSSEYSIPNYYLYGKTFDINSINDKNMWDPFQCLADSDCDDNDIRTTDTCIINPGTVDSYCQHSPIRLYNDYNTDTKGYYLDRHSGDLKSIIVTINSPNYPSTGIISPFIGVIYPGGSLYGGGTASERLLFFGLLETQYWTQETEQLFENSVTWVLYGECMDIDGDGYGNPASVKCEYEELDCNDNDASINPGEEEIPYDGKDNDCADGDLTDVDNDGYNAVIAGGNDCDDEDAEINPGAEEIIDDIDQNCVNDEPFLVEDIPDISWDEDDESEIIYLDDYFADYENDNLEFGVHDTSEDLNITVYFEDNLVGFTSPENWNGNDWIIFYASDGDKQGISNIITLTVLPVNDAPVLNNMPDVYSVEGDLVDVSSVASAEDIDSDDLIFSYSAPLNSEGKWQTNVGDAGNYQANIVVSDGELQDSGIVNIHVLQKIVINEFEINGMDGEEWVEIYNPSDNTIDISGWKIYDGLVSEALRYTFQNNLVIEPDGHSVADVSGLNNDGEFLILKDNLGNIIDITPELSDATHSMNTWQRISDGLDTDSEEDWIFQTATKGFDNEGDVDTPVLNSIGNKEVSENSLLEFSVLGEDLGEELVSLTALNLPEGAVFESVPSYGEVTGTFTWILDYEQAGTYNVEFIISDGELEDRETITITVLDTNRAPELVLEIENQNLNEDSSLQINLANYFSDADGDELFYSASGNDKIEITIANGIATLVPEENWYGFETVTFMASDPELNKESNLVHIIVNPVNDASTINSYLPDYIPIISETGEFTFNIQIIDIDSEINDICEWDVDSVSSGQGDTFVFLAVDYGVGEHEIKVIVNDGSFHEEHIWTIIVSDKPVVDTYTGDTTDFSGMTEEELANVNLILEKENGKVEFLLPVDLRDTVDFENYVKIMDSLISIDSIFLSVLKNIPAKLTFYNLNYEKTPGIYYNNGFTSNYDSVNTLCSPDKCSDVEYNPATGTLSFNVNSFSTYKVGNTASCSSQGGKVCGVGEYCSGTELSAIEDNCCKGICLEIPPNFSDIDEDRRCGNSSSLIEMKIKNPDNGDDFAVTDEIDAEIDIRNRADEDLDFDVYFYLYDITENEIIDDVKESLKVDEGERENIEVQFDLNSYGLEDSDDFAVFVSVIDDGFCAENYVKIDIKRERHDVVIKDFILNPEVSSCNQYVDFDVEIENIGKEDEDVYLVLTNSELGINEKGKEFELKEGDDYSYKFNFKIPDKAEKKEYSIKASLFFNDEERIVSGNLVLDECLSQKFSISKQNTVALSQEDMNLKEMGFNEKIKQLFGASFDLLLINVVLIFGIFVVIIAIVIRFFRG